MKKKQKVEKRRLKKLAKFHMLFSVGLFVFYIALSLIYSPDFLLSDVRHKFKALADDTIIITGKVLGPPVVPIVSGDANCNTSTGTLSVNLSWPADENSDSFDISREGLLLVSGLSLNQYEDDMVAVGTTYNYIVTAHGPMGAGFAVSDPIAVSTPAKCAIVLPAPIVNVISINGKNVASYVGTPEMTELRPTFSGTTNIPNANVHLDIYSSIIASADIQANVAGFWSWTPPVDLSLGAHTLFVSAVDPLDVTRTTSTSQEFNIVKEKTSSGSSSGSSAHKSRRATTNNPIVNQAPIIETMAIPLDFSLDIAKNEVFQGKDLTTKISISRLDAQFENSQGVIIYSILDKNGQLKESFSDDANLHSGEVIARNIPIPTYYKDGQYSVQVEITLGKYDISRVKSFSVLPLPLLNFGGGVVATYPQILSQLGTASLWLLLGLIIWLLLFSREYWLYLHALRHITENNLGRIGLFGERKRKGVSH
jgi:hypothetical protein